jgi:aryl-alcohol dehydrogenase-like predicted oxidoreductase
MQKAQRSSFTFGRTKMTINRMGYGAMRLSGPHIFGPPKDMDVAVAVLRQAVELGVNHIDTSDYYGPHTARRNRRGTNGVKVPWPELSITGLAGG